MAESGLDDAEDTRKHRTLFSRVGLKVSGCLKGKTTCNSVIEVLDALYLTKRNELFLRHQAMKSKQGELCQEIRAANTSEIETLYMGISYRCTSGRRLCQNRAN